MATHPPMLPPEANDLFRLVVWRADSYVPTPVQAEFLDAPNRLKLVAGGIRAGKSKSTARDFDKEIFTENGLVWIVGPDYEQGKPEWNYLYRPLNLLGKIANVSQPEKGSRSFTTTWNCRVQTKSSDDLDALASFAPNAILMVEAAQQAEEAYFKCLERALEFNARVTISGTFEGGFSWYHDLWEKWQGENEEGGRSFSIPSWSNSYIFPGGRDDPKIKALESSMPYELFMERCGAVPYKPSGLVFREFDFKRHVRRIDFNPDLPVEIAIDPAQHTYAVLAIQWNPELDPQPVYVVDEIYAKDSIGQNVIPQVKERPWFKYVKSGVIDVAGTQRHANKSQVEVWAEATGLSLRHQYVFIEDSINVVRLRLQRNGADDCPLLQFDYRLRSDKAGNKAMGTLAEMGLYRWREWKEGQASHLKPVDANNDGLKALGYWLYDKFGPVVQRRFERRRTIRVGY
jgi:hypothetical protein